MSEESKGNRPESGTEITIVDEWAIRNRIYIVRGVKNIWAFFGLFSQFLKGILSFVLIIFIAGKRQLLPKEVLPDV